MPATAVKPVKLINTNTVFTKRPSHAELVDEILTAINESTDNRVTLHVTNNPPILVSYDYNTDTGTASAYVVTHDSDDEFPENEIATWHANIELDVDYRVEHALTLVADAVYDYLCCE